MRHKAVMKRQQSGGANARQKQCLVSSDQRTETAQRPIDSRLCYSRQLAAAARTPQSMVSLETNTRPPYSYYICIMPLPNRFKQMESVTG